MPEPLSVEKITRLRSAIKASYKKLRPFREKRMAILEQYVGSHYGEGGAKKPVPMNILALTINIYARNLYARNPNVKMNTPYPELKPMAHSWELSTNKLLKTIDLETEALLGIVNALTSLGVMKVGLNAVGEVDIDGQTFPIGRPYAKIVDLDDWVHDSCARTWDEIAFCGNSYRVPLEWAKENALFKPEVREKLSSTDRQKTSTEGGDERVQTLSSSEESSKDEYVDYVDLWDIWLPYENMLVTLAHSDTVTETLAEQEYDGPPGGPYHLLPFIDVPGNIMPCPPAAHWLDMHLTLNSTWRKLARQAKREKQILFVSDEEDGKNLARSNDGEIRKINNPERIKEAKFGGPDQIMSAFVAMCRDAASWNAGNLDSIGGLSVQSETLGQDQLISQNSSKQLQAMTDRTVKWIKGIVEHLAWLQYADTMHDYEVTKNIAGFDVPTVFTAEERAAADFAAFNIDVEPFSMQPQTPQQKVQAAMGLIPVIGNLLPGLQAEGKTISVERILDYIANNASMPEIKEWIQHVAAPPVEPVGAPQQPPPTQKPAFTKREYVRKNIAGSSRQAKDAMNMIGHDNLQPSEQEAMTR